MKTIIVTSQKGGSGKSTLVRNLAVTAAREGLRVLCLDLDPQQTLRQWWQSRDTADPAMLAAEPHPTAVQVTLAAAQKEFDLALVEPLWLRETLPCADLVLVPVRPSPDDLRAVGATLAAVNTAGVPLAFVLSQTPRARITKETARILAQHGRVAPVNIAQRVAYAETGATGQGVAESSDVKAKAEIAELWEYLRGLM